MPLSAKIALETYWAENCPGDSANGMCLRYWLETPTGEVLSFDKRQELDAMVGENRWGMVHGEISIPKIANKQVKYKTSSITFSSLPTLTATDGSPYSSSFVATGGTGPYTYAITTGALPTGLALNGSTGAVTGTPTISATFTFQVTATDSLAATGSAITAITVSGGTTPPLGNPVAVHTFSDVRTYLSTRSAGAPGSGGWTVAQIFFNGFTPTQISTASAFSSGALTDDPLTENRGANARISAGGGPIVPSFLGNGSPDVIHAITVTGFVGKPDTSFTFWSTSFGAFSYGGSLYEVATDDNNFNNPLVVISSLDGTSPWSIQDPTHGPPSSSDKSATAIQVVDNYIFIFTANDFSDLTFQIYPFNMATGLWETPSVVLTLPPGFYRMAGSGSQWSNGLIKFLNGNFAVFYMTHVGGVCNLLTGGLTGSWGAPIALSGDGMEVTVIDPSLTLTHIITSNGTANDYSTLDQNGTYSGLITTIPALVGATDGVGHPSIQNGMMFIPRDDHVDFTNAVWVATLPVTTFFKEFLPLPPEESNQIAGGEVVHTAGTGYALNDTARVVGGVTPAYLKIIGVDGGSGVTAFQYTIGAQTSAGSGYSVASDVATVNAGIQPGSGTGFTVDIIAVDNPVPSCAYMMFPNGYSQTIPPTPISIACPVSGGTGTVGVPYSAQIVVTGGTPPYTFMLL